MKMIFTRVAVALFLAGFAYSYNELQRFDISPRYSVINSSALAEDSSALFLNPAGLVRVDRMNAHISTANFMNIGLLGFSAALPGIGGVFGASFYNVDNVNKRGFAVGWGKDLAGWFSLGLTFKTVSSQIVDFSQGLLFDFGILITPNESTGLDLFKNRFLNNKIFLSVVLQNVGKQPYSTNGEDMNLRVGAAYYLQPLWTKLFVEKNFLTRNDTLQFGVELRPEIDALKFLSAKVSYDFQDIRVGAALIGEDARLDVSYDITRPLLYFSLSGYFEKNRTEQSREYYDQAMLVLVQAQEQERQGNEKAYLRYRQAYNGFKTSLGFDRNNRKAAYRISQIEDKISELQNQFLNNAESAEEKKDWVTAIMYYNLADQVQGSAQAQARIKALNNEKQVKDFIKTRKAAVKNMIKAKKYLGARKELDRLLLVVPNDSEVNGMDNEDRSMLRDIAHKYLDRAQDYYNRQRFEDCVNQAKYALSYYPELERASELIDMANAELGTQRGIEQAYEQFRQKNYMNAYRLANWILKRNPRSADAMDLKNRLMKIFQSSWKYFLEQGLKYYNSSDFDKAVEEFDKVLLGDPGNSIATEYRNRAASKLNAMEKLEGLGENE